MRAWISTTTKTIFNAFEKYSVNNGGSHNKLEDEKTRGEIIIEAVKPAKPGSEQYVRREENHVIIKEKDQIIFEGKFSLLVKQLKSINHK